MSLKDIPMNEGKRAIGTEPQNEKQFSPEIFDTMTLQYSTPYYAYRELGQNSVDSGCSRIDVRFRHEPGYLICEWKDDGMGMDRDVVLGSYIVLFDSFVKEGQPDAVGEFGAGRLSVRRLNPERIECVTRPKSSRSQPGYRIFLDRDWNTRVLEVDGADAEDLVRELGGAHGTLVRLHIPVESAAAAVEEVGKAVAFMEKELAYIRPDLWVTTAVLDEEGEIQYGTERINRDYAVPGRKPCSVKFRLRMPDGSTVRVALGVRTDATTGHPSILLSKGLIPIEYPSNLTWTRGEEFYLYSLHVMIDADGFEASLGRNRIFRTQYFQSVLDEVWKAILKYAARLARGYGTRVSGRRIHRPGDCEEPLRRLFAEIAGKGFKYGFQMPPEIEKARFVPGFATRATYSLLDLDAYRGDIFFTYDSPSTADWAAHAERRRSRFICISLAQLSYELKEQLEHRLGARFKRKEHRVIVVDENDAELGELSRRIQSELSVSRLWANPLHMLLDRDAVPLLSLRTSVGRFVTESGSPERETPALYLENPSKRVCLNASHPHIRNLTAQIDGEHQDSALFMLVREALNAEAIKFSASERERLLMRVLDGLLKNAPASGMSNGDEEAEFADDEDGFLPW